MSSRLEVIRQRAEAATPGPWSRGNRWLVAGTGFRSGEGKCAYCGRDDAPLVWSGRTSINGRRMDGHIHEMGTPWTPDGIYSAQLPGVTAVVVETDEYGTMDDADAAFISNARQDIPALLVVAEAAREFVRRPTVVNHNAIDAALWELENPQ